MNLQCMGKPCLKPSLYLVALVHLFLFSSLHSEQVGIFKSNTPLNSSDTVEVLVPDGIVALSASIPIEGDSTAGKINSTSLFFMVDHSGSMYHIDTAKGYPMDGKFNRMSLVSQIVDSLANNSDKFPNIECGLGVFGSNLYFDSSNNNLLEFLPNDSNKEYGTYLPLLELNKQYSEVDNKTGREIIKELVEFDIGAIQKTPKPGSEGVNWPVGGTANHYQFGNLWYHDSTIGRIDTILALNAKSHEDWYTGTKIDFGYKSAVAALKESQNEKKNRFIIFLSDGMGTDSDFKDGFINGKEDAIPTTFTIFFTHDSIPPELLVKMADSIKVNGYSESNPIHTLVKAYENKSIEDLVGYVMDSIISIFESGQTTKPNKIVINNDTSDLWDASNGFFTFSHALALTDFTTDFPIDLDLTIHKDSIGDGGEIIDIKVDSSFSVLAQATIDENLKEEDADGEIEWWDRTIKTFRGLDEVDSISEVDNVLNVTFNFDQLDSDFKYTNAKISIKCLNSKDSLTLDLEKINDNLFEKELKLAPVGSINFDDDELTPENEDEIILTFRNSESYKFPLDTLQTRIYYNISTEFVINEGALFDDDANGICDRVQLKLSGDRDLLKDGSNEIAQRIKLPDSRDFSISKTDVKDDILNIYVSSAKGINTGSNSDDKATVNSDVVISTGGILKKNEIELADSMAPVITKATLYDNPLVQKDSLVIKYSEDIKFYENDEPFNFYNKNKGKYKIPLGQGYINKKNQKGELSSSNSKKISEGDSINIIEGKIICDVKNIYQENSKNRKVEIEIIRPSIEIELKEIVFIDPKGFGYPTLVKIDNSHTLNEDSKPSFEKVFSNYLEEIEGRELEVDSTYWDGKELYLICSQNNDDLIKTIVSNEDRCIIDEIIELSQNVWLPTQVIEPKDSMAPVLLWAICIDSIATDSISHLHMRFSEEIDDPGGFSNKAPYLFRKESNIFPVDLYNKNFKISELKTVPNDALESEFWKDLDSVRINPEFEISDGNTKQLSEENRMVKLQHVKIAPPLELELKTTLITPDEPESYIIVSPLNKLSLGSDNKIEGTITIIDNVGNHVIKDHELEYNKEYKYAILKWDGKNDAGRDVGSGLYPVIADIKPIEENKLSGDIKSNDYSTSRQIQGTVGVKY